MNKVKIIALIAVIVCAAVCTVLIGCMNIDLNTKADSGKTTVGFIYTVKEYDGKVAVFYYGDDEPIEVLNCRLSSLPPEDIAKISSGIDVANDNELQQLIEAYD